MAHTKNIKYGSGKPTSDAEGKPLIAKEPGRFKMFPTVKVPIKDKNGKVIGYREYDADKS
tara:strand:+ start:1181 stop:1360 length:180 start_codon:yes stop_codon:yes gene_type:complete